jgi:hypothetical protein
VPLLAQLLAASDPAQAAERAWLLRLLAAGLRGPADGPLYRRGPAAAPTPRAPRAPSRSL